MDRTLSDFAEAVAADGFDVEVIDREKDPEIVDHVFLGRFEFELDRRQRWNRCCGMTRVL